MVYKVHYIKVIEMRIRNNMVDIIKGIKRDFLKSKIKNMKITNRKGRINPIGTNTRLQMYNNSRFNRIGISNRRTRNLENRLKTLRARPRKFKEITK